MPSRSTTKILGLSEKVVYYVAAVFLLVTVVMLFVSAGASMFRVLELGLLESALEVWTRCCSSSSSPSS